MELIKCEDYHIIKIRYYTSEYYIKKFHNREPIGLRKQWEAAVEYNNFFWKFIEKITGNGLMHYILVYGAPHECVTEEIMETHGIIITGGEVWYKYLIPKPNEELVKWIKENVKNEVKILKRTNVGFLDATPTKWRREMYVKN